MTTRQPTKKELEQRFAEAGRMISGHRGMLATARRLGMESEIDHQTRSINEWEAEYDDIIDAAFIAGYGPEDFE